MPEKGTKWTPEQVGLLRAWVDQGAAWDASVTFAKPEPRNLKPRPIGPPDGPEKNPIDRFLAAYFTSKGVTPPAVVDDRTFARRVYLDAIGLLPTPQQLDEFANDQSPDKRVKLVQRLLADNANYADHWLSFWNDLLRNDYRGTGYIDEAQTMGWLQRVFLSVLPF